MSAKLFQIYYEDSQKSQMFPFAIPHYNESLTIFFENEVIHTLVMAENCKKIAVCSWKLREKLRWFIGRKRPLTQELLESDYDVLSFTKNTKYHRMLDNADAWHPGFKEIFKKILDAINVPMPPEVKTPIYQNHFSARIDVYRDYVSSYLVPAMEIMANDKEINVLAMQNSNYSELNGAGCAKSEDLQKKIGVPYYPLAPFLLERLFSVFVHNKKINVTHL